MKTFLEYYAEETQLSIEEAKEDLISSLSDIHMGDCTNVPCACGLCQIEVYLEWYRKEYLK
jgi:hypothetical protein